MATTSLSFLAFSIIAALFYHLFKSQTLRQVIMLVANLSFLASFSTDLAVYIPFAGFLALGYAFILIRKKRPGKQTLAALIIAFVLIFCWLKKYWFLSFVGFLPSTYLTLGLSYIFFRVLALIIDIAQDETIAHVSPLSYLNFTLNFPTLVAGPIQRYQDYAQPEHEVTLPVIGLAIERIIIGLFKVIALSNVLSLLQASATVQMMTSALGPEQLTLALGSIGLYPLYLYYNFSGYTDIVIGIGMLFGKKYPENFNRPFSSLNFIEFWSRWHMTLSSWLRDYVYTPFLKFLMQSSSNQKLDPYLGSIAFFVTFFLIGIWHGSTVIFAIYGLLLALGVSVNKLYQVFMAKKLGRKEYKALAARPLYQACCRGLTYAWYAACMLCFWATGEQALGIVEKLGVNGGLIVFAAMFVIATIALSITESLHTGSKPAALAMQRSSYARAVLMGVLTFLCLATIMLTQKAAQDIVYQAF